jgi:phthalate 4,5-cis-dihydrodiol dehydrogenase
VAKATSLAVLRIGVIGLGIAGAAMIPAIRAHAGFVLAGVADTNPELRRRFALEDSCVISESAADLIARSDIDAIYVATPHQMHRDQAVSAANSGKHVIVEKPMALSLEDCDEMIEAARRNKTALVVGHTHGFNPAIKVIREIIDGGEVGRISMVALWNYTDFLYRPRRREELDTSAGGGIIFNQIPHQVDIIRTLNPNDVLSVRASTAVLDPARPTEGSCTALLTFANGGSASLVYSGYDRFDSDELHDWVGELGQPKRRDRHGATRRALGSLDDREEASARAQRYGYGAGFKYNADAGEQWRQPHFGTLIVSCEHADIRPTADAVMLYGQEGSRSITIPESSGVPGRAEVLDELYHAAVDGLPPLHGGTFARCTLQVCLAILKSAQTNAEVILAQPRSGMRDAS